MINYYY